MAQVILPSMHKALSSNPTIAKRKKRSFVLKMNDRNVKQVLFESGYQWEWGE
jgi:hypothetical protein